MKISGSGSAKRVVFSVESFSAGFGSVGRPRRWCVRLGAEREMIAFLIL